MEARHAKMNRRQLVVGAAGFLSSLYISGKAPAAVLKRSVELTASETKADLVRTGKPTDVWAFNRIVPGPEIRIRRGERVRVRVKNELKEETTVHWHGVRVPNDMDGVPHLTQQPIRPGEDFEYSFVCPDAGTYWYHPHQRSFEQVGRGLYGPLIVEDHEPLAVDREITWVLGDWRLLSDASISNDFGHLHDLTHAGRIGNTVTVNGQITEGVSVRAGERIRLRLINAATARIFGLEFENHSPLIIAYDGHAVEPHSPENKLVVLGPGMRIDVLLDFVGEAGTKHRVVDRYYRGREYRLLDFAYSAEQAVKPPSGSIRLAPSVLPEPDLASAARHEVILDGGMMSGMQSAIVDDEELDVRALIRKRLFWAMNGVAATSHAHKPMLTLKHGQSCVLKVINRSGWPHPMHLHGHAFRLLSRNGQPTKYREWLDTVLIAAREEAEIAFVADNHGDWMFHCHILEHDVGGMKGVIRVV
jgi:FtsP/CotA-like multicopper oxidase with cupredoxin domain